MKIIIVEEWEDELLECLTPEEKRVYSGRFYWGRNSDKAKVDVSGWSMETVHKVYAFLDKEAQKGDRSAALARGILKQWIALQQDPNKVFVSKLENFPAALKAYIKKGEHRWLFQQFFDGSLRPFFVNRISYTPASPDHPAYVTIDLFTVESKSERSRETVHIYTKDIVKKSCSEVLLVKGFLLETPEAFKNYLEEVEIYKKYTERDGVQMNVIGKGTQVGGWSRSKCFVSLLHSGRPARMVVSQKEDQSSVQEVSSITCSYWESSPSEDEELFGSTAEGDRLWLLPLHPVVQMFDLDEHDFYHVHVNNMSPYVYNTTIGSKLVLPEQTKDFINLLIEYSSKRFSDIVEGKEGGTIILIEGLPGVGKTLTAEVYSEVMERPLYRVHSSQLGVSPEGLEKELQTVLSRAENWGAILLIDEADVFVHSRGTDIRQNAIVGVFLRLLEYYRGVLFMTTNRGTEIDDAIISRLTARFHYAKPTKEEQQKIWRILLDQNEVKMMHSDIIEVTNKLDLSGRDIKNILKLAVVASQRGDKHITPKLIEYVASFKQSGTLQ